MHANASLILTLLCLCSCAVQAPLLDRSWRFGAHATGGGGKTDSFVDGPAGQVTIERKARQYGFDAAYHVGRGFEVGGRGTYNQFREEITTDAGFSRGTGSAWTIAPTVRYYFNEEGRFRPWIEGSLGYGRFERGSNSNDETVGSYGIGLAILNLDSFGQIDIGLKRDWILGDGDFFNYEDTALFLGLSFRF